MPGNFRQYSALRSSKTEKADEEQEHLGPKPTELKSRLRMPRKRSNHHTKRMKRAGEAREMPSLRSNEYTSLSEADYLIPKVSRGRTGNYKRTSENNKRQSRIRKSNDEELSSQSNKPPKAKKEERGNRWLQELKPYKERRIYELPARTLNRFRPKHNPARETPLLENNQNRRKNRDTPEQNKQRSEEYKGKESPIPQRNSMKPIRTSKIEIHTPLRGSSTNPVSQRNPNRRTTTESFSYPELITPSLENGPPKRTTTGPN
ncbi:hypothetical protein C922_05382 [Plasmodium inui San Antonio 1]|uniref:Uncharacterized protein n=1 Tax=Plasmodium inui San Antonio 1 TaxID=1237626 RepID=W6ZTK2_9APIC|nr:hypothetical protein C922_05382 [Plasmodium inui San Antonio 1]EUD64237.1 hypothetical protein C922_05382 [Plasmodium inui San Antonio 1]